MPTTDQPAIGANLPVRSRGQGRSPEGPSDARRLDVGDDRDSMSRRRSEIGRSYWLGWPCLLDDDDA